MSDELWAVHVEGPDDVHAAPSKKAAQSKARTLNQYFRNELRPRNENDPTLKASVVPWDGDAESHAADLAKSAGMWA